MTRNALRTAAAAGLAVAISLTAVQALAGNEFVEEPGKPEVIHRPNPRQMGKAPTKGSTSMSTKPISFHGGPTIATPTVYVVWYGNWGQANGSDTAAGKQIVRDFAASIGGSPHFLINTSYGVTGGVNFTATANETTDNYSRGSRLKDSDILTVIKSALSSGRLPYNPNGVYFVLTSSDVALQSGFCTRYCGWHTYGSTSFGKIRYSFVGNANRCLSSCAAQSVGPNGNAGVDGMISVIAHELEEAATDPDLNAWYDSSGYENADKCAWTFGQAQYKVASGAYANVHLGSRDFLIQRNLYHGLSGPQGVGDYCMVSGSQN